MSAGIDIMVAPDAVLPAPALPLLQHWRALCGDDLLPDLHAMAPAKVPPALLPWTMTFRRDADRNLTYGVVGEELAFLFRGNPRGGMVLNYATPEVRAARYAVIHRALDEGIPVWYTARLLFESGAADIGRLGLPTRTEAGAALLLIYIPLTPLPEMTQRRQHFGEGPSATVWLGRKPAA
ncbi:hypothetical protein [Ferrovibrio terrae]|uniref:hypothetical protein n=1 Tax=Ferrovibrio terrae TaxID=2594003 RepID=UPI0031381553